jgi:ligand-binding sensor domain-containing protein
MAADRTCAFSKTGARAAGREMGLPRERWGAILEDPDGALWVRSEKSLYMRSRASDRFECQRTVAGSADAYPVLALDSIGRLLVPTDHGLVRRTTRGREAITVDDGLGASGISAVSGIAKEISGWACWDRDWRAGWATTNGRVLRPAKDSAVPQWCQSRSRT